MFWSVTRSASVVGDAPIFFVPLILATSSHPRYGVRPMPRFKYYPPFRISYRYDCNFSREADTIEEAVSIGLDTHPMSLICVKAKAVYDGVTVPSADVGNNAGDADGKSVNEIMELYDKKVDDYIACRVKTGRWMRDLKTN
ncbi:MAG: hypothetical protein ABL984_14100 [Pyrinomonadaceae bacterium]